MGTPPKTGPTTQRTPKTGPTTLDTVTVLTVASGKLATKTFRWDGSPSAKSAIGGNRRRSRNFSPIGRSSLIAAPVILWPTPAPAHEKGNDYYE